jgi:LacI family transcriptional regulator
MSKITIEDISKHTGLSRGTVSRALNDRPDISQQTKERVLDACRQLNYVPSHAARSLATGRRYAVAVLVDDLRAGLAGGFLRGVIVRARSERYAVHVSNSARARERARALRTLVNERVDGVLIGTPLRADLAQRIGAQMNERPLVAAGRIPGAACDVVSPDYMEVGRLVARHILRGDSRRVLYVDQAGSPTAALRRAGFQEVCRASGIEPAALTVDGPPRESGATNRLDAGASRRGEVTAIAASDDCLAVELMMLCASHGRMAGRDIAVIGQGNESCGAWITPSLTTVDYGAEEIGQRAMDIALQRVTKARQDAPQEILVAPALVVRESTRSLT